MKQTYRIPLKLKIRWFLQGMASLFGPVVSVEQRLREIEQCTDEMIQAGK